MAIVFQCPSCEEQYQVPPDTAGKAVICRECGESMRVPQEIRFALDVTDDEGADDAFLNDLDTLVDQEQLARKVGASRNQQRKRKEEEKTRRAADYFKVVCPSCYAPHRARHEDLGKSIRCTECQMIIEIKTLVGSRILLGLAGLGVGVGLGSLTLFLSEWIVWQAFGFFDICLGLIFGFFAILGSDERVTWLITMFESRLQQDGDD